MPRRGREEGLEGAQEVRADKAASTIPRCEICGFTCRQKASLNWHRRKHAETAAALRFPCELCGKRFEKLDSVAAHRSRSHPDQAPRGSPGPEEPPGVREGSGPAPAPQAAASLPRR